MEIVIAKHSGFCVGVKKAVDTAIKLGKNGVYVLGEIIHNEEVVKSIESRGVKTVNSVDEVPSGATLIIRSHGVGKDVYAALENKNVKIVDCTCGFVAKIHSIVEKYNSLGYSIVIVGEKTHPEVVGTNGWCENKAVIVGDENDLEKVYSLEKVCLVSQTTYSNEKFNKILSILQNNFNKTLEIFPTICYTTKERQDEAEILSQNCDAMIVIGGKHSSNTRKLYDICAAHCKDVFLISTPVELEIHNIKRFKKVGIVSGASTPYEQSVEVFTKMSTEVKVSNEMEEAVAKMDEQPKFKKGQKIKATISSATDEGLALYIVGTKKEILLPKDEINCEVYNKDDYAAKLGDEIEVMIVALNPVQLSEKAIAKQLEEEETVAKIKDGQEFTVTVDGFNKGGLTAKLGSYSVFIPSSQIRVGFVKDLEKYVGKTLTVKATQVESEARRKNIVASARVLIEAERAEKARIKEEKEAAFFANINEGDVVKGTVVRFAQFGAFVDVNGFDCLAHISDLSWGNVKSPAEVLELNKEYEFKVLKCDKEQKKVSIGYKQLQPRPWDLVADKYIVGDVITGKVVRVVNFGVFVEVEPGIDGLVHVSQISHEWLEDPKAALTVGQEVEAKIIGIDFEKEKMTLSIKAMTPAPERQPRKDKKEESEGEEKPAKARKPRKERTVDPDEVTEWNESEGGVSIAELLNNN